MELEKILHELEKEAFSKISSSPSTQQLGELRTFYLGRKGKLTLVLKEIGKLSPEERPRTGRLANKIRKALEKSIAERQEFLAKKEIEEQLEKEIVDITLPGKIPRVGKKHLITQIIEEVTDIFLGLGYKVAEGPEVELDWYNFEALNTPVDHPARSLQDTLYVKTTSAKMGADGSPYSSEVLLRTHTSPVQIRVMEKQKPPVYLICPGKTYRRDVADPSHSPMFHQIEGLVVDKNITFGDLRGTLETFVHQMFGAEREVRLRPHFFPFTEPSAEVDVSCIVCGGQGCRLCGGNGWLEILGCGMVDPNVFLNVGYDPEAYTGFAFGMGVERIAMLKYGISDIRLFFENDLRFLRQF